MHNSENKQKKRFLIVKLGALGDLFFALPTLTVLKKAFQDCEIDWLTGSAYNQLLKNISAGTNIIPVPTAELYGKNRLHQILQIFKIRKQLVHDYDGIFLFHRANAYLAFLCGKGPIFKVARTGKTNWLLRTLRVQSVACPPLVQHETAALLTTVKAGVRALGYAENLDVREVLQQFQSSLSVPGPQGDKKVLGLHIGGGSNTGNDFALKRWPHWAKLVNIVLNQTDFQIRIFGAESDAQDLPGILAEASTPEFKARLLNLVGTVSLADLPTAIAQCHLFCGPDSGPLHIADTLGVKTLGLYGPTSTISWGLIGTESRILHNPISCSPCYLDDGRFPDCPFQNACMRDLPASDVFSALKRV